MKTKKIIYKGVVITQQPSGKYKWYRMEQTLKECKKDIDREFGGLPPLTVFSL